MSRFATFAALLLGLGVLWAAAGPSPTADAHCEVPCGIYDDAARFDAMLEDTTTIRKAMVQIGELSGKGDALSMNQLVRWVTTKEDHATRTMDTIAQYFMAQRLKPADGEGHDRYVALLTDAHAVMRAAMTCKQTVDVANADALKAAIERFRARYQGRDAGSSGSGRDHHGDDDHGHDGDHGHDHR